jgi:nucleoside-diphosphate-sugar epimerase
MHKDGVVWDYIFYLALESKLGLPEQAYEYGMLRPAIHIARYALAHHSMLVIQSYAVAHVRMPSDQLATEDTPYVYPKHGHSVRYALKGEETLRKMEGLKLVVLRESITYGPDVFVAISTTFVLGRIFKEQGLPTRYSLPPKTRLSCAYVKDVARAYWHVAKVYPTLDKPVCVYNVACPDDLTEGRLVAIVAEYFKIPVKPWNPVLAKLIALLIVVYLYCVTTTRKSPEQWIGSTKNWLVRGSSCAINRVLAFHPSWPTSTPNCWTLAKLLWTAP